MEWKSSVKEKSQTEDMDVEGEMHMRLEKIQEALQEKKIVFTYTEEDGLGSLDFQFRGLRYHIWEFEEDGERGIDTNIRHAGRSEDITGDYETIAAGWILDWPDMAVPG